MWPSFSYNSNFYSKPVSISLKLFFCRRLNINSFLLFNNCLVALYSVILISPSKHKLQLLLKLFAVEDFLIYFHFICGISPRSFKFRNYFDWAVWFLSCGLMKECLWLYGPGFQYPGDIRDAYFLIITISYREDVAFGTAPSTYWAFSFFSTITALYTLSYYLYEIYLLIFCNG